MHRLACSCTIVNYFESRNQNIINVGQKAILGHSIIGKADNFDNWERQVVL